MATTSISPVFVDGGEQSPFTKPKYRPFGDGIRSGEAQRIVVLAGT